MGICSSRRASPLAVFMDLVTTRGKLTKEQIQMVDTYLPDFCIHELSTDHHRQIAASHWDAVFKESRSNSVPRSYSVRTMNADSDHDATRDSTTAINTQTSSKISALYDAFYAHLDHYSPELKPLFRSSLYVKSKVLVHISAGMRSILASDHVAEKLTTLTKTHMRFGVHLDNFNALGNALLHAMATVSEDAWTTEVADAWRRLFAHCSAMLLVTQKKLSEQKDSANYSRSIAVHAKS